MMDMEKLEFTELELRMLNESLSHHIDGSCHTIEEQKAFFDALDRADNYARDNGYYDDDDSDAFGDLCVWAIKIFKEQHPDVKVEF